jgi:squalene synthase HpnD
VTAVDLHAAYGHCEHVTRTRARNFLYGIRLLPLPKRRALCAVYAFARRIDDIGDGPLDPDEKLRRLAVARADLADLADLARLGTADGDPVLLALADTASRYPVPLGAFAELVDGVEADVRGASYETFEELLGYCRCVAGSIGRLSLAVFGPADPARAPKLADALGVAMQLTNILRDLREDAANGRVYLPAEDRARFGWNGTLLPTDPDELVRYEAARARAWFERGMELLPLLDRRSAACVAAMAGIYSRVLRRIDRQPRIVLERRVSLPAWEKALVAAKSLAGLG